MNCEIITIGSELLSGQVQDTNAAYLAQNLNLIGFDVSLHISVGDSLEQIKEVIAQALTRSELIIATGGLGPTKDDLTREAIADVLGVPLIFKQELMDQIQNIFHVRGYSMPENNRKQAFIPEGSLPIPNDVGTAPGFMAATKAKLLIALPGVPKELRYLFTTRVIPYLKMYFHLDKELISSKILRITGIGESKVDSQIKDLMNPHANPRVGLLASPGDIRVVVTAHAKNPEMAASLIEAVEGEIATRLGKALYGRDDDTLEAVVTDLLRERGASLSIVETFTGGELTARLNTLFPSPVVQSTIIGEKDRLHLLSGNESIHLASDGNGARALSDLARTRCGTSIGLAVVGVLRETENDYEVDAHAAVSGDGIDGAYHWKMGGDLSTLQIRGSIIALNTLRLALIE
ncbi:MAG: CinA family nicotinamide mononucleotide deamidase-related protein [Thermodesulfobacteriota bacterium]